MSVIYLFVYILTAMKFYFIIKSLFSIRFFKTLVLQLHQHRALTFVNSRDIVCGFLQYWHVKCNLPLTYAYSACLPTSKICSHISLYIVNHQECFKKIITMKVLSRNHQLRTRLPPSFVLIRRRVCKMQFRWSSRMEWPRINQSASTTHQPYHNSVFLVSSATRTQFLLAITQFWSF